MHNSKLKQITVALCLALLPLPIFAAGLGKLNVSSGLGEPLKADIELLSVTPEDLNSIVAAIASEEAYTIQGIEKPASHNTIKIEIGKNASGLPILKLKSSQPISEPFLDMLIQVDWATGKLLREYTVLLDPPGYAGETANDLSVQNNQAPIVKPNNSGNNSQNINPANSVKKSQARVNRRPVPAPQLTDNEALQEDTNQTYTTQRGDSLAAIAQRMKPDNISLDQMLVGLYQANPDAFDANNMNRLKVGKILRQPSEQELSINSRQAASTEVKIQAKNWNIYRNKLAEIVAKSAPSNDEENAQSADGKIKSAAQDQSLPATSGTKDVVKLSAGEIKTGKSGETEDVKALQAKITALQEENTAREKSITEAQARTTALEKQIDDMKKLLTVKSVAMADLQDQSANDKSASENAASENAASNVENADVKKEEPSSASKVVPAEVAVITPAIDPKPVKNIITSAEPEAKSSLFDGLDLPLLAVATGLLALLGAGWMFLRNKRRLNLANFEQGIMTSGGLKANTVFGNTSGSKVDTGDTSFLTDFSQSANGGMIDTNDVDPIAEAEVYMAYGRDAQAEEILKDAISKEPKRYELHLKLLEMYATSKNFSAFETIAGELYTTLGADDPTWAKVAEIGSKLEPGNPLYQVKNEASNGDSPSEIANPLDAGDFSGVPIAVETDLDFSFDNDSLTQDFATKTNPVAQQSDNSVLNDQQDQLLAFNIESDIDKLTSHAEMANFTGQEDSTSITPNALNTDAKLDDSLDFDFGDFETKPSSTPESTSPEIQSHPNDEDSMMQEINMSAFEISKQVDLPKIVLTNTDNVVDSDFDAINSNFDAERQSFDSQGQESFAIDTNKSVESFSDFDIPTAGNSENADLANASDDKFLFNKLDNNEINFEEQLSAGTNLEEPVNTANNQIDAAKTFDFSDISLELNDDAQQFSTLTENNDSIEIETKLSLVLAYIEMDDLEGAKEMLDEVMNEGSENQRKRAQEIATKLG